MMILKRIRVFVPVIIGCVIGWLISITILELDKEFNFLEERVELQDCNCEKE